MQQSIFLQKAAMLKLEKVHIKGEVEFFCSQTKIAQTQSHKAGQFPGAIKNLFSK